MSDSPNAGPNRIAALLRDRAVALLRERGVLGAEPQSTDLHLLVSELQTHQIELELQNEELHRTQMALANSRDRFASLYEYSPLPYFTLDSERRITSANLGAEHLYGVPRSQMVGLSFSRLVAAGSQDILHLHMRQLLRQPGPCDFDLEIVTDQDEIRSVSFHGHRFTGEPEYEYLVALVDITDRKRVESALGKLNRELDQRVTTATAELTRTQLELRSLISGMVGRQEQELGNIARELHDTFGQDIAAISLTLGNLARLVRPIPSAASILDNVEIELRRVADNLRNVSRHIHPKIIEDLGLETALRRECELLATLGGCAILFSATPFREEPAVEVSLACYRILQESLRNVIHHAKATEAQVQLCIRENHVLLRIADDGTGFNREKVRQKGGLGLISMEERSRLVSGKLRIDSAPDSGTVLEFTAPVTGSGGVRSPSIVG